MAIALALLVKGLSALTQPTPQADISAPATSSQIAVSSSAPHLSDKRRQHILHGNKTGGGHLYGTGNPCESEFPASWTEEKIITEITKDAANDNLGWQHQGNGNDVAEVMDDGVKIRLVVDAAHQEIITAYPLNTPRNPCTGHRHGER